MTVVAKIYLRRHTHDANDTHDTNDTELSYGTDVDATKMFTKPAHVFTLFVESDMLVRRSHKSNGVVQSRLCIVATCARLIHSSRHQTTVYRR